MGYTVGSLVAGSRLSDKESPGTFSSAHAAPLAEHQSGAGTGSRRHLNLEELMWSTARGYRYFRLSDFVLQR